MPPRARGYLFEYEIVKLSTTGPIIRYNNLIYKPGTDAFETFKETEEPQTMSYPTSDIDKRHEAWNKATAKCNAKIYLEKNALLSARKGDPKLANTAFDMGDIDVFFQEHGCGSHLLEYDFTPDTPKAVPYTTENGQQSSYWRWTHKHTKISVKRYATASGKSFDSGRLSKYLRGISQQQFPLGYARAQKILLLNKSRLHLEEAIASGGRTSLDRKEILQQQVRFVHFYASITFSANV